MSSPSPAAAIQPPSTCGPPDFADLQFRWYVDEYVAETTDAWWIYWRADKHEVKRLGFSVVDRGGWVVIFDPAYASDTLRSSLDLLELKHKDPVAHAREMERRRDVWRAEHERLAVERDQRLLEKVEAHRQEARDYLKRWGLFTVQKAKLAALVEKQDLTPEEIRQMRRLVEQTEEKSHDFTRRARGKRGDAVDWSDADVVDAIRALTLVDADQASLRNDRGWSAADSSWGHWCNAQLDTGDRDIAIKVGRVLVGAYASQIDTMAGEGDEKKAS